MLEVKASEEDRHRGRGSRRDRRSAGRDRGPDVEDQVGCLPRRFLGEFREFCVGEIMCRDWGARAMNQNQGPGLALTDETVYKRYTPRICRVRLLCGCAWRGVRVRRRDPTQSSISHGMLHGSCKVMVRRATRSSATCAFRDGPWSHGPSKGGGKFIQFKLARSIEIHLLKQSDGVI